MYLSSAVGSSLHPQSYELVPLGHGVVQHGGPAPGFRDGGSGMWRQFLVPGMWRTQAAAAAGSSIIDVPVQHSVIFIAVPRSSAEHLKHDGWPYAI